MDDRHREAWKKIANRDKDAIFKSMLERSQELKAGLSDSSHKPITSSETTAPNTSENL